MFLTPPVLPLPALPVDGWMGAAGQMFCSTDDDDRVDDHFDRLAVKVELIPPFCNDFFPGKDSL